MILLNTTEPTHFTTSTGNTSAIDLTLCSPNVSDTLELSVLNELYDSDHYPIRIDVRTKDNDTPIFAPRWKLKKADWTKYRTAVEENIGKL